MRTGGLLVRAARAVRAIGVTSLPVSFARIEHGQTKQKLTIRARGYSKKKNALFSEPKFVTTLWFRRLISPWLISISKLSLTEYFSGLI